MHRVIKVLHVVGFLGKGGDTTAIMNIYNYMKEKKNNITFDFLTHDGCNQSTVKMLEEDGCKVFILDGDVRKMGTIKYYKKIKKILKSNNYDAIHFHTSFQSCIGLMAAKKAKIKIRICHSHTTNVQRKINILKRIIYLPICRLLINHIATKKVSCSIPSGEFLFGKKSKYDVIYNGLKLNELKKIDKSKKENLIKKYDLNNKIVIGQVGNFNDNKNQQFTLKLAKELDQKKYIFFFLGDGVTFSFIKNTVKENNLKNVILTGRVNDVNVYMSIFDFLLLPSQFGEGLPVTLIEQQIINDNCECITSNIVTNEANLGNVVYLELEIKKWIENIKNKKVEKIINIQKFDINNTAKEWLMLYEQE